MKSLIHCYFGDFALSGKCPAGHCPRTGVRDGDLSRRSFDLIDSIYDTIPDIDF